MLHGILVAQKGTFKTWFLITVIFKPPENDFLTQLQGGPPPWTWHQVAQMHISDAQIFMTFTIKQSLN